ncbi:MAG: 4Fe-4S binding protein [Bacteroidales bacterium]|nr:4Fe-4S binding protein [Bacteroidales bacterium]
MITDTVHLIYFSPTHSSCKIAEAIAKGVGAGQIIETDITLNVPKAVLYIKNTLTIISVPVYGGRCAETAMERMKQIKAIDSPVILSVLYGNRDYEDALRELRDFAVEAGFVPVSGGAFIGEHSYSRENMPIAKNRPDEHDLQIAFEFGKRSVEEIKKFSELKDISKLRVKGHYPYKEKKPSTPAAPVTDMELCSLCGTCIELCPTQAIESIDNKIESDKKNCIKCCACVKECPSNARIFDTPYTEWLYTNFSTPKEPELFYIR